MSIVAPPRAAKEHATHSAGARTATARGSRPETLLGSERNASVKGQYHARMACRGWRSRGEASAAVPYASPSGSAGRSALCSPATVGPDFSRSAPLSSQGWLLDVLAREWIGVAIGAALPPWILWLLFRPRKRVTTREIAGAPPVPPIGSGRLARRPVIRRRRRVVRRPARRAWDSRGARSSRPRRLGAHDAAAARLGNERGRATVDCSASRYGSASFPWRRDATG